ncbi:hypothetical protein [Pseudomonas frederiksbergensis]|uniref:Uncharacterized protein n=1 Tax=Pseudomonas frederiksbergensis TaxID=104087 RepID=A0AB33EKD3_9PSED|nr:hypothetical protein [Pseudomonas frederiksbergensis]ATE80460.1 hypothetical protein CNN82_30165 [Pseudomonas frederiksbergensis]
MLLETIRFTLKRGLSAIAALFSLISGMFWHISAKQQMDALDASVEAARKLTELSIQFNLWTAYTAVITGVCLACALFFED